MRGQHPQHVILDELEGFPVRITRKWYKDGYLHIRWEAVISETTTQSNNPHTHALAGCCWYCGDPWPCAQADTFLTLTERFSQFFPRRQAR